MQRRTVAMLTLMVSTILWTSRGSAECRVELEGTDSLALKGIKVGGTDLASNSSPHFEVDGERIVVKQRQELAQALTNSTSELEVIADSFTKLPAGCTATAENTKKKLRFTLAVERKDVYTTAEVACPGVPTAADVSSELASHAGGVVLRVAKQVTCSAPDGAVTAVEEGGKLVVEVKGLPKDTQVESGVFTGNIAKTSILPVSDISTLLAKVTTLPETRWTLDVRVDFASAIPALAEAPKGVSGIVLGDNWVGLIVRLTMPSLGELSYASHEPKSLTYCGPGAKLERVWTGTSFEKEAKPIVAHLNSVNGAHAILAERSGKLGLVHANKVDECPAARTQACGTLETVDWCPYWADGTKSRITRGDLNRYMRRTGRALICVDLRGERATVLGGPRRNVLPPNIGLEVVAISDAGETLRGTWGGKQGVFRPTVDRPTSQRSNLAGLQEGAMEDNAAGKTPCAESRTTFSPRQPGVANLELDWGPRDPQDELTVEIEVEPIYWGALRAGFGVVFGDAAGKEWTARSHAGSNQAEVVLTNDPRAQVEGIVGFAPYLFDVFFCPGHGRSHTNGCSVYVAPYFGFGLISQTPGGVDSFNSVHLGMEVEFAPSFSGAFTAVWRKTTDLTDGYAEGSPVDPNTEFTRGGGAWGLGFVLNVSPDFLQFQRKPSETTQTTPAATTEGSTDAEGEK